VDVRNVLVALIKHNLLKITQSDFDQLTYYSIDDQACLLRLSMPRYLIQTKLQHGDLAAAVLEEIYLNGSLFKSELVPLLLERFSQMGAKLFEGEIIRVLEELTMMGFISGAKAVNLSETGQVAKKSQTGSKRKAKAARKEEEKEDDDNGVEYPLRINALKFLTNERRDYILKLAH